jgi:glycosyltransferase involved in cell wall biosynthesis
MRIALLGAGMISIPPPDYGAVEKHVWNLARCLEGLGHDVTIVNEVFGPRSADEYRFGVWAARRVKKGNFDVVHVHTPGVALAFSLLGPKEFVYTTHSRHWATREGLGENVGFFLEKRAVKKARRVIAVSPAVATELVELDVRGTVIPNGVDVDKYAPATHTHRGDRVVGLGEIAPHKKWHLAAEAIRGLNAHLTLVGPIRDPRYGSMVEDAAPGQVTLLGPVPEEDLVRTLAESDVLVHPSVSESFGMAVVEDMACGLPVVASDIIGDLVRDGENGFKVPTATPEDERVQDYRKHLEILLADARLRKAMGARSRERAVAEYSWERVAERVAAVYAEAPE